MRIAALLYHDVVPQGRYDLSGFQAPDDNLYKIDCVEFRRQLKAIAARAHSTPETMVPAGGAFRPDDGRRRLLLTFDDGGVSAILHTAEILEEFGWPGHFFMTTDRIGAPGFLDASQLRALRRSGHAIGSHSCSHPERMIACSASELDHEWRDSVWRLEDILGEPVTSASIPCGFYTRPIASAASAAGIQVLFTSEPVTRPWIVDGCLIAGRFCVHRDVSTDWVSAVVANRPLPRLRRYLAWNGRKMLRAAGGPMWLKARKAILARR
ncbi:MAG TPA: polysaccharide deacetylase family protein [Bryobacteraceae bacterium]|jgi:peptidoglycan/xylan/chitin deacetylase (PgdA/CDA1 family)